MSFDRTLATHYVGERDRIRVVADEWERECPIEWNPTDTGMLTIRAPRDYNGWNNGDEADAVKQRILLSGEYDTERGRGWMDDATQAGIRYLKRRGYDVAEVSLAGYSQGDWADVLIWAKPNPDGTSWLPGLIETVQQWFRGDIYTLIHERAVDYVRTDNREADDPDLTEWEMVDSLGGCYIDDYSDSDVVVGDYRDHFDLPELDTVEITTT